MHPADQVSPTMQDVCVRDLVVFMWGAELDTYGMATALRPHWPDKPMGWVEARLHRELRAWREAGRVEGRAA